MKILVTGANGYIGRHIVTSLLNQGHEVIACDIRTIDVDSRAQKMNLNIFEEVNESIFEQVGSPDVCLHMAWRNGFVHNSYTQMGDLSAHYLFLNALIDGGLKHLAVMGSMHEVGYWEGAIDENTPCNPISLYGIAKDALRRAMTQVCESKKVVFQWLRCFYILGDDLKNNSIFSKLIVASQEGKTNFPFTSGKNKYDFIDIDELADIISKVITQKDIVGIINCCSGEPISLADRVEQFIKERNLGIKLEYGVFADRPYDSPCIYGDTTKIDSIPGIKKNI